MEKQSRQPKFIVFSDIDGTINLEDKRLQYIIDLVEKKDGLFIPISGRTVGDIKEQFSSNKIKCPEIIVGDNGGAIYNSKLQEFISKNKLEEEKVKNILQECIRVGINPNIIRYTNGEEIFASNDKQVQQYYRKNKTVNICKDIVKQLLESKDVTKITLAGSKSQMQTIKQIIEKTEFWSDMDKTKFPNSQSENYRLDIAPNYISKGNAVKNIIKSEQPKYGYMCIGNGQNDISMFEQAVNDGMIAIIVKNQGAIEMIKYMKEYSRTREGKVIAIPATKNLANRYIYKSETILDRYMIQRHKQESRLPSLQRIKLFKQGQIKNSGQSKEKEDNER